jgi:hypothetical protein
MPGEIPVGSNIIIISFAAMMAAAGENGAGEVMLSGALNSPRATLRKSVSDLQPQHNPGVSIIREN